MQIKKKNMKQNIESVLLDAIWLARWNKSKTALKAVLTGKEAIRICKDIIKELDNAGYKIINKKSITTKIIYEARLNKDIKRNPYGVKTIYKKSTVICKFSEREFKKLTKKNINDKTDLCICEGHGVYEYFDLEKDIEFVKIQTQTTISKNESIVKLKN